jgi:hypothetical protein
MGRIQQRRYGRSQQNLCGSADARATTVVERIQQAIVG